MSSEPGTFVAPQLPPGFREQPDRGYSSLTPWLPLILSGLALACLLAFVLFGIFALGEGFSLATNGREDEDTRRFGAFIAVALVSLGLWALSVIGAIVSLIVAVAKGYTRSLWMTPAVLFASAPVWLVFAAL